MIAAVFKSIVDSKYYVLNIERERFSKITQAAADIKIPTLGIVRALALREGDRLVDITEYGHEIDSIVDIINSDLG